MGRPARRGPVTARRVLPASRARRTRLGEAATKDRAARRIARPDPWPRPTCQAPRGSPATGNPGEPRFAVEQTGPAPARDRVPQSEEDGEQRSRPRQTNQRVSGPPICQGLCLCLSTRRPEHHRRKIASWPASASPPPGGCARCAKRCRWPSARSWAKRTDPSATCTFRSAVSFPYSPRPAPTRRWKSD